MSGCVTETSRVTLHYRMALEEGTEVDSTFGEEPLTFTFGDGTLYPALERHLLGMGEGEHALYLILPEDGFGPRDETNIQTLSRSDFDPGIDLEEGMIMSFALPNGEEIPGAILAVEEEAVRVDFNHPLAGRPFSFEVELLCVE